MLPNRVEFKMPPMLYFAQPASILPIDPRTKRPRCFGGVYGASSNTKRINKMFASALGSGFAVATGAVSGIDVLDIDPRNGGDNWLVNNAYLLPHTLVHRTPRGGWHIIMKHSSEIGCPATLKEFGVDIKGNGGYIVWPPTTGYSIARDTTIKEWPKELLNLVRTYPKVPPPTDFSKGALKEMLSQWPQTVEDRCSENRYARAALMKAWSELQGTQPGNRGTALYRKAYGLGGIVYKGWISATEVADRLWNACIINGLIDTDGIDLILRELFRGLSSGLEQPWKIKQTVSNFDNENRQKEGGGAFGDGKSLLDNS